MKRILTIALAAAALLSLGACKHFETVKGDPLKTQIYTLDNGLQVYMSVNKEEPRIQTYIAVRTGGKNGPDESTGLAHYFEHLMFKGTESFGTSDYAAEKPLLDQIEQLFEVYRKTTDETQRAAIYHKIDSISYEASKIAIPNEYDKLMATIGADGTNAWTSMDETVYQEDIPSNQIDNWARIQADRFRNIVLRGFHTELETIYEEKNMSLTQDSRKIWEALDAAMFPHHPYGQRTVLGTQDHLKNPSITNVKKFHDDYYVPNNIRICVAGDFDPKEMVAAIEKYFGDWEPNPSVPVLKYEKEQPVTEPVVREVYGLEAETVALGWRLPGVAEDLDTYCAASIASSILSNGASGLIDLDVIQQQKVLALQGAYSPQPDYSQFIMMGRPKEGQTLDEVKEIGLEEISKLRNGEFDESLIKAIINNEKLYKMRQLESNAARANMFVDAFINNVDWKDFAFEIERLEKVTKDDVVAFANKYLADNAYAIVYKRQGEDTSVQKISAPAITPIVTNRDMQSDFLTEIQNTAVKPIEPVFVDFNKDMAKFDINPAVDVLYKQNTLNDIFEVEFVYNEGAETNPMLGLAWSYLKYLGTADMSAEEIATRMYELACDYSFSVGANQTTVSVSGLSENMAEAVSIIENLIANAQADEAVLANLKADMIRSRLNNKKVQSSCYNAIRRYVAYGPEYVSKTNVSNDELLGFTSDQLLSTIRGIVANGHEVFYYGPMTESALKNSLADCHRIADGAKKLPELYPATVTIPSNEVILVQYDAKQIYYYQQACRDEKFNLAELPAITLYNNYFGGGMNTVVFQEMREARGLAYSAWANLFSPSHKDDNYSFGAFIATQNDKMRQAVEAFDDIINNMPESEAAFKIAKESLIGQLRTQRTTGASVLSLYASARRLGIDVDVNKVIFEKVQSMELKDVVATQQKWVKGRNYCYSILGDIKDLDMDFLKTLGPVRVVTLEEIFGY